MGRLIDADALLQDIRENMPNYEVKEDFLLFVHAQPTAYNVEKVVEQLEEKIEITWEHDYRGGRKDAFNEAIDIVKKGGVE